MRKKHLLTKALTLVLSAAICAGGTGLETLAASVEITQTQEVQPDGAQEQADTVSANDAATEENGDTVTDPEESQEEVTQGELADPEETDDENETTGEEETEAGEEDLDADEALQMPNDDELFARYADEKLSAAVVELYNKAKNTDEYSKSNLTIGLIKSYTGALDFTQLKDMSASDITDITGLGYARNVSAIDISTTNVTKISSYEFNSCASLTEIKLPDTLTIIEDHAFAGCSSLKGIDLPVSLIGIGGYAFSNCSELAYVNTLLNGENVIADTLPDGLESVGTNAFAGCSALVKITIPSFGTGTILEKASSLFANCTSLSEVKIGSSIQSIPNACFYESGNEKTGMTVTIEAGSKLDKIMDSAFEGANMSSLDLSGCAHLAAIDARAFAKKNAKIPLTEIRLAAVIQDEAGNELQLSIGKEAFYQAPLVSMYAGNSDDQVVTLPDYVKSVGVGAFAENEAMNALVLGSSIQTIGDFAFNACKNLATVTQSTTKDGDCATESIGTCAFRETGFADASFLGKMNHLKRIGGEEQHLDSIDDREKSNSYIKIKKPDYKKNYVLKNEKFGSEVFTESKVQTVVLPASIEVIESRAFYNCESLESVTMESGRKDKGVTCKINSEAFRECEKLKTAILPDNEKMGENLEIDKGAFLQCKALDTISKLEGEATYNGKFPKTLAKLADNAYDTTGLKEVLIQDREDGAMPEIGTYVFMDSASIRKAVMPQATVKLEKGLFYDCGINDFSTSGTVKNLEEIDDFALFGSTFDTLDLSAYTKLKRLGSHALAYRDLNRTPIRTSQYSSDSVKKLVLPANIENDALELGEYLFRGASRFNTMQVKGEYETDGIVCIPDYVTNDSCVGGTFSGTAVEEAHWQYTETQKNPWTYIPHSMFNAARVSDISKCLLPVADLKEIKEQAFLGCMWLNTVDLRPYTQLDTLGEGVFAECFTLKSAYMAPQLTKLPNHTFFTGFYSKITSSAGYASTLQYVDLGNITELGEYCFASVNLQSDTEGSGTPQNVIWPANMQAIDLSKIKKIGKGCFLGQTKLTTVKFGEELTVIGNNAFQSCASLSLKPDSAAEVQNPAEGKNVEIVTAGLPDSLESIGDYGFYRCENLDTVIFGSKLNQIGKYAFSETIGHYDYDYTDSKGLYIAPVNSAPSYDCTVLPSYPEANGKVRDVINCDFTQATNLAMIGDHAFYISSIGKADLQNTKVKRLESFTFADCPKLDSVELGNSFNLVADNSLAACPRLTTLRVYTTTTISKKAFAAVSVFNGKWKTQAIGDLYNSTGEVKKPTIDVTTEPVTTIGIGGETTLPYYVTPYVKGDAPAFTYLLIGDESSPDTIDEYMYVEGRVSSYYYKKNNLAGNPAYLVGSDYFTNAKDAITFRTDANQTVETIKITGLKPMQDNETVPFSIATQISFVRDNNNRTQGVKLSSLDSIFTTTYNIHVANVPYRPVLYTDSARTKEENVALNEANGTATLTQTIRACKKKANYSQNYYFDLKNLKASESRPNICNLIIESSDPSVIAIAGSAKQVAGSTNQWKVEAAAYNASTATASAATRGRYFSVAAKKPGAATVKVYPEGSPQQTVTITYNVVADIQSISLTMPTEFAAGVRPGDTFNVLNSVRTYLNGSVSKAKNDLGTLFQLTDNKITYTSDKPQVLSVDAQGNVTVQSVTAEKQTVKITATVITPDGDKVEGSVNCNVAYPPMKNGAETKDSTGASVTVKTAGSATKQGEVSYTKPAEGVTNVTIPATVVVDGVTCKVTEVSAEAFKGNKTVQNVTIQADVTTLPNDMFKGCTNLQAVTLPSGITSVPSGMFNGCGKLKTIKIPGKVTEIGANAFKNCKALTKITIPKPVKTIGNSAFSGCSKLKTVTFHKKAVLTTIGNSVFSGCKAMKAISLPKKLESIGSKAFYKCGKLKTIKIQSTVLKKVGKNAFKGIYKKATIKVPKKKLGEYKNLLKKKGQSSKVKIKK